MVVRFMYLHLSIHIQSLYTAVVCCKKTPEGDEDLGALSLNETIRSSTAPATTTIHLRWNPATCFACLSPRTDNNACNQLKPALVSHIVSPLSSVYITYTFYLYKSTVFVENLFISMGTKKKKKERIKNREIVVDEWQQCAVGE